MTGHWIDQSLESFWKKNRIEPNPLCDDATFLRRITLDLAGRIPCSEEFTRFKTSPDRIEKIDELLESDSFSLHWANLWTSMLNGYADAFGSDRESLRLWLVDQFTANQSYDSIVTGLVTATGISSQNGAVNFLARHFEEAEVKVSRLFLGIQIDCARCHDHPFDRWTEDDFSNLSRFFDSMERNEGGPGNVEITNRLLNRTKPRFLTGASPRTRMWREELALFMQHTNAYSKNFVNRIWYQLIGRGIVHSPDNFHAENSPSIPELLDALTAYGKNSGLDFRQVIREICSSAAYQRSSVSTTKADQSNLVKLFAIRPIKPLTPEQWYSSVSTISVDAMPVSRVQFLREMMVRPDDNDFDETWKYRETVQQMMQRLSLDLRFRFKTYQEAYGAILCRDMTADDHKLCAEHSLSDVTFALLNSNEFFFNH